MDVFISCLHCSPSEIFRLLRRTNDHGQGARRAVRSGSDSHVVSVDVDAAMKVTWVAEKSI